MRPAVRIGNGIGETEDLVVVRVVILENTIDEDLILLPVQNDRLGMNHLLVLPQLPDELLNAVLVEKSLELVLRAFVSERDLDAGIEKGQFPEPIGQELKLKLRRDREDGAIGLESDECARLVG